MNPLSSLYLVIDVLCSKSFINEKCKVRINKNNVRVSHKPARFLKNFPLS